MTASEKRIFCCEWRGSDEVPRGGTAAGGMATRFSGHVLAIAAFLVKKSAVCAGDPANPHLIPSVSYGMSCQSARPLQSPSFACPLYAAAFPHQSLLASSLFAIQLEGFCSGKRGARGGCLSGRSPHICLLIDLLLFAGKPVHPSRYRRAAAVRSPHPPCQLFPRTQGRPGEKGVIPTRLGSGGQLNGWHPCCALSSVHSANAST
jgi:hypothetical protein